MDQDEANDLAISTVGRRNMLCADGLTDRLWPTNTAARIVFAPRIGYEVAQHRTCRRHRDASRYDPNRRHIRRFRLKRLAVNRFDRQLLAKFYLSMRQLGSTLSNTFQLKICASHGVTHYVMQTAFRP